MRGEKEGYGSVIRETGSLCWLPEAPSATEETRLPDAEQAPTPLSVRGRRREAQTCEFGRGGPSKGSPGAGGPKAIPTSACAASPSGVMSSPAATDDSASYHVRGGRLRAGLALICLQSQFQISEVQRDRQQQHPKLGAADRARSRMPRHHPRSQ